MKKFLTAFFVIVAMVSQSVAFATAQTSQNTIDFSKPSYAQEKWSVSGNGVSVNAELERIGSTTYEPRTAVYNDEILKSDFVFTADVQVHDQKAGNKIVLKAAGIDFAFDGAGNLSVSSGEQIGSVVYRESTDVSHFAFLYQNRGRLEVYVKNGDKYSQILKYVDEKIANKSDGKLEIDFSYVSGYVENIKIYDFEDVMYVPEFYEQYNTTEYRPYLKNFHLATKENLENGVKAGEGYQICYSTAIGETDPNIMLRGFDTSGVYYSHDGGESWHSSVDSPDCILALAFYPGSSEICFALVGGLDTVAGIYKSVDGGVSFERTFKIPHRYVIRRNDFAFGKADENGVHPMYFAISNNNNGTSVLGDATKTGVFKSTDVGESFTNIGFENYFINGICADRSSDDVAVAVGRHLNSDGNVVLERGGLYISRTAGASWEKSDKGIEDVPLYAIGINPANTNEWVCSIDPRNPDDADNKLSETKWVPTPPALYKSFDAGKSWNKMDVTWQTPEQEAEGSALSTHGTCVAEKLKYTYPDADGKNSLIVEFDESVYPLRISSDGGEHFTIVDIDETNSHEKGSTGWYVMWLALTPADPNLVLYQNYISHDGGKSYVWKNSGISGFIALGYDFDEKGIRYIAGYDMGRMARSEGYSGDYPLMGYKDNINYHLLSTYNVAVDPKDPKHIFSTIGAVTYGGESCLIESFDALETYTFHVGLSKRMQEMTEETGVMKNITFIEFSPSDPNVVYTSWFVSSDNGKTWRESEMPIAAISPFDEDVAYTYKDDVLYITRDRAKTWENTGITLKDVRKVRADLFDDYVVWCASHSAYNVNIWRVDLKTGEIKVMGTENGLRHKEYTGLEVQISDLKQSPLDKNVLFAVTRDYWNVWWPFFVTYDGGDTWHEVEGFPRSATLGSVGADPNKPLAYISGAQGMWVFDYQMYRQTVLNNIGGSN